MPNIILRGAKIDDNYSGDEQMRLLARNVIWTRTKYIFDVFDECRCAICECWIPSLRWREASVCVLISAHAVDKLHQKCHFKLPFAFPKLFLTVISLRIKWNGSFTGFAGCRNTRCGFYQSIFGFKFEMYMCVLCRTEQVNNWNVRSFARAIVFALYSRESLEKIKHTFWPLISAFSQVIILVRLCLRSRVHTRAYVGNAIETLSSCFWIDDDYDEKSSFQMEKEMRRRVSQMSNLFRGKSFTEYFDFIWNSYIFYSSAFNCIQSTNRQTTWNSWILVKRVSLSILLCQKKRLTTRKMQRKCTVCVQVFPRKTVRLVHCDPPTWKKPNKQQQSQLNRPQARTFTDAPESPKKFDGLCVATFATDAAWCTLGPKMCLVVLSQSPFAVFYRYTSWELKQGEHTEHEAKDLRLRWETTLDWLADSGDCSLWCRNWCLLLSRARFSFCLETLSATTTHDDSLSR